MSLAAFVSLYYNESTFPLLSSGAISIIIGIFCWGITKNAPKDIKKKDNTIVVTQFPCKDCAKLIIESGLSKVVTFHREVRGRWWDDEPSKKLFDKYNIGVEIYGT